MQYSKVNSIKAQFPPQGNGCLGKLNQAGLIGAGFTLPGKVKELTLFHVIIHRQALNMAPLYHKPTAIEFVCMQKPNSVHRKTLLKAQDTAVPLKQREGLKEQEASKHQGTIKPHLPPKCQILTVN